MISIPAIANAVHRDGVGRLVKQDAVTAGTKSEKPLELALERLHFTLAVFSIAVYRFQNSERGLLFDGSELTRYAG